MVYELQYDIVIPNKATNSVFIILIMREFLLFLLLLITFYIDLTECQLIINEFSKRDVIKIGTCEIAININCPHSQINFFLYNRYYPYAEEEIHDDLGNFNPSFPTKILIHGYNSGRFLPVLTNIKREYFMQHRNLNIIMVDWGAFASGPCYPAAVWNTRFVGKCAAELVQKVQKSGTQDIHLIGFSLGAHVAGFIANNLKTKLSRITGLDPAMPGFTTVSTENKLDASDAKFVDIIHTNAFLQGIVQQSGHVDFYVNGGTIQPGCWAESRFFACNHHRSALYFAESINTRVGFWGWPCPSFSDYMLGNCLPTEHQIPMGEYAKEENQGVHLVITNSVSPFAVGKYTGPLIEILNH